MHSIAPGPNGELPVVLLMGPTASGKTSLAMELVQRYPMDIVSVDSAMVYRGMDIGTAKPSVPELARAPHRLIDVCEPTEAYSAGRFLSDALSHIKAIHAAGRVPLLAGGTMLYYRVLQQGLAVLPQADAQVRAEIDQEAARLGWPAVHATLAAVDPVAAARIHANDAQRIQRALEVFRLTGEPLSVIQARESAALPQLAFVKFALAPERATMHQRIEVRLEQMLARGFVQEVRGLYERGDLTDKMASMRAVGYRQFWRYCAGECAFAQAREQALHATRGLGKRQMTWLRSERALIWLDNSDLSGYTRALEQVATVLAHRPGRERCDQI